MTPIWREIYPVMGFYFYKGVALCRIICQEVVGVWRRTRMDGTDISYIVL